MEKEKTKGCGFNAASLTLGIISVLTTLFWYITYPCGILAVVFGVKGINKTNGGVAKAGLTLGIVGMSLATLIYLFLITVMIISY